MAPYCTKIQSTPKYQRNVNIAMQNIQGAGDNNGNDMVNTDDISIT